MGINILFRHGGGGLGKGNDLFLVSQLHTELEVIMNETFTLSSKTYLNLSEFQKHQFGISHNLCVHFGRLELLYPYILFINILHR